MTDYPKIYLYKRIVQAKLFIDTNFSERLDLANIADEAYFSKLKPANTIVFFLSSLHEAQNRSGKAQPEQFDAAFLIPRYKNEYDLPELPSFVKKVIIPITYRIGMLLGKYKKFKDAPEPV